MQSLGQDINQRLAIGDSLSRIAHEYAWGMRWDPLYGRPAANTKKTEADARASELAQLYYNRALEYYGAAEDLNQTSLSAAARTAYCLWRLALDARKLGLPAPDAQLLDAAANDVRAVLNHLAPKDDINDTVDMTTILVELEIAQGKPEAAVSDLGELRKKIKEPEDLASALYYLVDTAHAYTCAALADPVKKANYQPVVTDAWARIQAIEAKSEFRPITGRPGDFNLGSLQQLCFHPPAKPISSGPRQ